VVDIVLRRGKASKLLMVVGWRLLSRVKEPSRGPRVSIPTSGYVPIALDACPADFRMLLLRVVSRDASGNHMRVATGRRVDGSSFF